MRKIGLLLLVLGCVSYAKLSVAQVAEGLNLQSYKPISLKVTEEPLEEETSKKKKKRKRKVFYGIKTKRGFVKKGFGAKMEYEIFHYLKTPGGDPDTYVRSIRWFNIRKRKLVQSKNVDPEKGYLLHGTYKRMRGNAVVEEGIYYYGMRHGRWVSQNSKGILGDKRKYYKGWPKDARVSYYDQEMVKIKEVVPVRHGEVSGWYYRFFDNGKLAVQGRYHRGKRIGQWVEYYRTDRSRRKRVIQFDKELYGEKNPFIAMEWDINGKKIYDSPRRKKR